MSTRSRLMKELIFSVSKRVAPRLLSLKNTLRNHKAIMKDNKRGVPPLLAARASKFSSSPCTNVTNFLLVVVVPKKFLS